MHYMAPVIFHILLFFNLIIWDGNLNLNVFVKNAKMHQPIELQHSSHSIIIIAIKIALRTLSEVNLDLQPLI